MTLGMKILFSCIKNRFQIISMLILGTLLIGDASQQAEATRIKDITQLRGVRDNDLIGYGLVIGLTGTGDTYNKTTFTIQALLSMLNRQGIRIPPEKFSSIQVRNIASVMVTAKMHPFSRRGNKFDVLVSSIGDAKSLKGGTLLLTPLKGVDGKVYALAQGAISNGGFEADSNGSSVRKNHVTVAGIPDGATVELEVPYEFSEQKDLQFNLKNSDFTTVTRMVKVINQRLRGLYASARDPRTVRLEIPSFYTDRVVELVATVESLHVETDEVAKVILNERTGTIIMGAGVRISPVAISHGSLVVRVDAETNVSQPQALSEGETEVTQQSAVGIEEEEAHLMVVDGSVSLADVVKGLNALGVSPRDLISILQAIKAAGALKADLQII